MQYLYVFTFKVPDEGQYWLSFEKHLLYIEFLFFKKKILNVFCIN